MTVLLFMSRKHDKLDSTVLITDFKAFGHLPSVNDLLDRRLALKRMYEANSYPESYYEAEIKAVDYLLDVHNYLYE